MLSNRASLPVAHVQGTLWALQILFHCRKNHSVLEWALSENGGGETLAWEKNEAMLAFQESIFRPLKCCVVDASSHASL